MDDFIDTTGRNPDSDGELVLRNSEALDEVFHEDFARVNRSNLSVSSPGFCVGIFRPLPFVLLCVCFLLVAV